LATNTNPPRGTKPPRGRLSLSLAGRSNGTRMKGIENRFKRIRTEMEPQRQQKRTRDDLQSCFLCVSVVHA
jgi:hypothetical protein